MLARRGRKPHRCTPTERGWTTQQRGNIQELLWPLRVRVPRLPRRLLLLSGEPDAVVVGDVEDVIADVLVAESDKEKQRGIAASIEHQLLHDPKCYMCEMSKIKQRQKRNRGRADMGEAPTKLGAHCTGDHLIRQRGLGSEGDAF